MVRDVFLLRGLDKGTIIFYLILSLEAVLYILLI